MSTEPATARRPPRLPSPTAVAAWMTGRRAGRSGALWGGIFGVYVAASALGYAGAYPSEASRRQLASSLGSNPGLAALLGQAHRIDTVAGFTAWRSLGVLGMAGAVWGLLAGTRLLRGEEETGRWDLVLAGQTTARRATAMALAGLGAGWAALLLVTAAIATAAGRRVDPPFSLDAVLFLSLAVTASAAMFLVIGALASQVASTRRQAAGLAGAAFGAVLVLRMAADSSPRLDWLRRLSPLGWVEDLHPMSDPQPLELVPIALLCATLSALTIRLAAARDAGSGLLPGRDTARPHTRLLGGPAGLTLRLVLPVALGWTAAAAGYGLVIGLVATSAVDATAGSDQARQLLGKLGAPRLDAESYLGVSFLFGVLIVGVAVAGQVIAAREEEATGRLDHLVVRPLARWRWLAWRCAAAIGVAVVCGVVAGLAAWSGTALAGTRLDLWPVLEAGINTVPPGLALLGLGVLAHALVPRLTAVAVYSILAWSFLVELVGSVVGVDGAVLDTSLLHHVAPVPAVGPDWAGAAGLLAVGGIGIAVALVAVSRRDLVGA